MHAIGQYKIVQETYRDLLDYYDESLRMLDFSMYDSGELGIILFSAKSRYMIHWVLDQQIKKLED
jgi:hypothetical protein